jgi:hypothetical protein
MDVSRLRRPTVDCLSALETFCRSLRRVA